MSIHINKLVFFIFITLNYFSGYSQIIDLKHYNNKININFENDCNYDSLKIRYYLKGANRNLYITNINKSYDNINCYLNCKRIFSPSQKIRLKKNSFFSISIASYYLKEERIGNISFDIYKKEKKIKTVKIFINHYNYVFPLEELRKTDTIVINKERKCLYKPLILFPNLGTTTCITILNKDEEIYNQCFQSEEKILIDYDTFEKGTYLIKIRADFFKKDILMLIN